MIGSIILCHFLKFDHHYVIQHVYYEVESFVTRRDFPGNIDHAWRQCISMDTLGWIQFVCVKKRKYSNQRTRLR